MSIAEEQKTEDESISGNQPASPPEVCCENPIESLVTMFVDMVQKGRIAKGQCPARRPVFLKPHGVAHGTFRMHDDIPDNLKTGLFAGREYPVWARFSSDTLPTVSDYKTTLGIALKLFDTPTPKIFGLPDETTFDFIMQNMDVFFVDTAKDMCEFTKAGVVDKDYNKYLNSHPRTKQILDEMAKPVGSVLASPYWSGLPFSLGPDQYVKYKLEPTIDVPPPSTAPADPTYLEADLKKRLGEGDATFRFCVQLRTDPDTMPLDEATVAWPAEESPYVPIADVVFPRQDIDARGQETYGENLSWNIWRVTEDHRPQGSIAEARKAVYAASANERRNVNGIPDGEPTTPKPELDLPPCKDEEIVRAAIHPAIGIARVGNAETEYYIGPEVTDPPIVENSNDLRTATGDLKRQAALFRIYGYNAVGEVVRELTASDADIEWTVHVANRKADWFRFITAMDIPETAGLTLIRRNADIVDEERESLVIDPEPRSITGVNVSGGKEHAFDTGEFRGVPVYLGELQTDDGGRLLFLGGHGKSASPSGAPPFDPKEPDTFNNANDWYDDIADGPVDATVSINGREIPVEGAWVASAPPNYSPDTISWRTMHEMLVDVYVGCGWYGVPETTSFTHDVLPQLQRMSNLQWVNKGFAAMFGKGCPMDFNDPDYIASLGQAPENGNDPYQELRQALFNLFRVHNPIVNEPRLWPSIYGDDFGGDLFQASPRTMLALPSLQQAHLERWVAGTFEPDWDPDRKPYRKLADVPLAEQPAMLDKAALHFCLADAFHPGCEMTWPMRHATMYEKPFRIRRRPTEQPADEYGKTLNQEEALSPTGPLHAQGPGDITQWMGLPWQGDTAYCRAGYDPAFDPFLPTFWPARVPNTVLTEDDYKKVVDGSLPREERIAAYNRRASWFRFIDMAPPSVPVRMEKMIAHFGDQGIIEARPGVKDDPDFPEVIFVENLPEPQKEQFQAAAQKLAEAVEKESAGSFRSRMHQAGWDDEEHLRQAVNLRARRKS